MWNAIKRSSSSSPSEFDSEVKFITFSATRIIARAYNWQWMKRQNCVVILAHLSNAGYSCAASPTSQRAPDLMPIVVLLPTGRSRPCTIFTCIVGPGNIRFMASIPLSTPSANTHWQWLHKVLVAFGVHTWQALRTETKDIGIYRFFNFFSLNNTYAES